MRGQPRNHGSMRAFARGCRGPWLQGRMGGMKLRFGLGSLGARAMSDSRYKPFEVAMDSLELSRSARATYERLSPEERRGRFVLSPAYRSAYNRLLDSEDRMTLPNYFLRKWVPILGSPAAMLYEVMRDISRVEAAGADSWCWPEQR